MSDLYLVLRSRLEAVADWLTLGEELVTAQRALGLSDERVAREVSVATRTWIRWRQRGQVPIYMVDRVAEVLQLEIERPTKRKVKLDAEETQEVLDAIRALDSRFDTELLPRLEGIEAELRELRQASVREPN